MTNNFFTSFSGAGKWRSLISWLLLLVSGLGLSWWAQDYSAAIYWLAGHMLVGVIVPRLDHPATSASKFPVSFRAFFAALALLVLFLATQHSLLEEKGWRGFLHLSDLPFRVWAQWLALLPVFIGVWLFALRQIQILRVHIPGRSRRMTPLILSAAVVALLDFTPLLHASYLPLFLSLTVLLLTLDIYLDNQRSSMTWLLLWWLLMAFLSGLFAHRQSLKIDQGWQQSIAQDIIQQGVPDTSLQYHLPFQWDTLSPTTAQERLPQSWLALAPGTGKQRVAEGRTDWIFHRSDEPGYIVVGRNYGGYRPVLALVSLIFLSGLAYTLVLRMYSWLFSLPYQRWLLPIFGPFTLRMRIQLAFFVLVLVAFFLVAVFTIDFFREATDFYQNWLEQLLSLYVFLLLIAGALGILIANSISEPIVRIGQKLGSTQLQDNEPLSWPRNDEIGRLVQSYNQMIIALDESAERLAASERESAWREMAKQVAHEIKNPLTPMKLQLQQLLRLEKDDPERAREWSGRIANGIIEQIDGLARIATAFSHFARLPEAQLSQFDLREVLRSVAELHQHNGIHTNLALPEAPCLVEVDRDQIIRVLNNLIRNAQQAMEQTEQPSLELALKTCDNLHCVTISDNGSGIPPEVQARIFQPNFTTKSSGMGLGLAMCKNIVEQAGGTIKFDTVPHQGTTFTVSLPQIAAS